VQLRMVLVAALLLPDSLLAQRIGPSGLCAPDATPEQRIAACTEVINSPVSAPGDQFLAITRRATAHRLLGDNDAAIKDDSTAIEMRPDAALVYFNRGIAWAAKKETKLAIEDYDSAIRLNPSAAGPWANRGSLRMQAGDDSGALIDLNEAVRLQPDAISYGLRGDLRIKLQKWREAIADYNAVLSRVPYFSVGSQQHCAGDMCCGARLSNDELAKVRRQMLFRLSDEALDDVEATNALIRSSILRQIADWQTAFFAQFAMHLVAAIASDVCQMLTAIVAR
jgi:tetratricopeptide (TPR) repeat protein